MVDRALKEMSRDLSRKYAREGRPSIPLEQVLYSIRSERLLIEQLEYNLLFRWFVGLPVDDAGLLSDKHFTVDGTLIEA